MYISSLVIIYSVSSVAGFNLPFNRNHFLNSNKNYPFSRKYYENYIKRLNSQNLTQQNEEILGKTEHESLDEFWKHLPTENIQFINETNNDNENITQSKPRIRILLNKNIFSPFDGSLFVNVNDGNRGDSQGNKNDWEDDDDEDYQGDDPRVKRRKSENFHVITKNPYSFKDVGGYDRIKTELNQCIDMLKNHTKYQKYSVRVPKGLILEGPPGNGKTLLAKALAGEANTSFISVSGSEFQEKYVGVGSSRIRELFKLAKKNAPCIIFIDEIDALGRARGNDGESSSAERDNTLNELLVALDGFKNSNGIFVVGATNRADLLDQALLRPGRIDKRIYIGNPDEATRKEIIEMYIKGKPTEESVDIATIVEISSGFSGAQIENLLNEAMLNALRDDRTMFTNMDLDVVFNKMLAGWQPTEHAFTNDIIDHIAIHELGHAVVGLICKHHARVTKVVINLSSPRSPAYTIFENANSNIYTREALFEHLMILLSGRIAEEAFYGVSVTTGAINDFEEALKLAEKMILYYGLGEKIIYPKNSEKYKEMIDNEITNLIQDAYGYAEFIVNQSKEFIFEGSEILKENKSILAEDLILLMKINHPHILHLKMMN
uniref:AAA+ ATPase domain-containing protein n=1 Tax=viral metagenome TaxID=1070528 RepID=A0A6C0HZT2_9ZZZZ